MSFVRGLRSLSRHRGLVGGAVSGAAFRTFCAKAEPAASKGLHKFLIGALGGAAVVGMLTHDFNASSDSRNRALCKFEETKARRAIANLIDDDDSRGPLFVRLAWHAAGTYDVHSGTGGSNGGTMRFSPESDHGANKGLHIARDLLEKVKADFPRLSYADLYTLSGVVAIEEMGGPQVAWKPGRKDEADGKKCPPDGRLPDAAQGADHIRAIFYRMGFNDQEIVALIGAHCLGQCHTDRSGFDGPWTRAPTTFSNLFYQELLKDQWQERKWTGPRQYTDPTGELMMLPADIAIKTDPAFRKIAEKYAQDQDLFFKDFAQAFAKLLELGVAFTGCDKCPVLKKKEAEKM